MSLPSRKEMGHIFTGYWPFTRRVRFEVENGDHGFGIYAYRGKRPAGRLRATIGNGILVLGDLYVVDPQALRPEERLYWDHRDCRKLGIGAKLLRTALFEAQSLQLEKAIGGVVVEDLAANPFLLDWYTREGFKVTSGNAWPERLFAADYTIELALSPRFT